MSNIIDAIEKEGMRTDLPAFEIGDTVELSLKTDNILLFDKETDNVICHETQRFYLTKDIDELFDSYVKEGGISGSYAYSDEKRKNEYISMQIGGKNGREKKCHCSHSGPKTL